MSETHQGFHQNRVVGVPSKNGQFDLAHQPEQPETVTMKLYDRGTGTCFNPPMCTTAAKALAFWQDVEIPDVTIERARTLYSAQQNQEFINYFQSLSNQHMAEWESANPMPRLGDTRQRSWIRERKDEETAHAQHTVDEERTKFFHADNPQLLGNVTAQQIVRAWFTYKFGVNPGRFPEEAAKLYEHPVELIEGSETIGALANRFRLDRFTDQLVKVPDPSVDAIHQLQDALAGILNSVSHNMERTANNTTPLEL